MKRIKAWLLAILTVISLLASLAGCAAVQESAAVTMGQWLSLVAESFGLETYQEEQPLFAKVTADNSYFSVFQACAEWDIVEPSADVNEDTALTYNDVLISLVNAGEFMDENATDKEKVNYAIEHFDSSIRSYWGDRYIKLSDACVLLDTAVDQWINFAYTNTVENIVLSDEVIDYGNEQIDYALEENVVKIDAAAAEGLEELQPGDVFTLPATDSTTASMYRVESVEVVDGQVVVVTDEDFSDEDCLEYIEEIKSQSTEELDLGGVTGIYDENGDPIDFTVNPNVDLLADMGIDGNAGNAGVSLLSASGSDGVSLDNMGFFDDVTGTLEFTKTDKKDKNLKWGIQITIKKSSIGVKISRTKTTASSLYKEVEQETALSFGFSNVNLTKDVDYSWGELKSATVKLNYKTTVDFGVGLKKSQDIGSIADKDGNASTGFLNTVGQFADAIGSIDTTWRDSKNDKSNEIYICKLPISLPAGFTLNLVIKGEVSMSGEVKLSLTINGASGMEYKKKNIRYINKTTSDFDMAVDAKIEATAAFGVELKFLKVNIVDFFFHLGAGLAVNVTVHLLDTEGHRLFSGEADLNGEDAEGILAMGDLVLTEDELQEYLLLQGIDFDPVEEQKTQFTFAPGFCFEIRLYPIVKITLGSENSLMFKVGKKLKLKLQWEKEFMGEDDTWAKIHLDFSAADGYDFTEMLANCLGKDAKCILANEPWPEGTDITGEETVDPSESLDEGFVYGGDLKLAAVREFMSVGDTIYLDIAEMPTDYTLEDLEVIIDDGSIISYDEAFNKLTALKEGTTQIYVQTKDKKYKSDVMAITVSESGNFSSGEGGGGGGGGGERI